MAKDDEMEEPRCGAPVPKWTLRVQAPAPRLRTFFRRSTYRFMSTAEARRSTVIDRLGSLNR